MSKLVRDKIVSIIIRSTGETPDYHVEKNYGNQLHLLYDKLKEEAQEVSECDKDDLALIYELADVYEVILSILNHKGYELRDLVEASDVKRSVRGSFTQFHVLDNIKK